MFTKDYSDITTKFKLPKNILSTPFKRKLLDFTHQVCTWHNIQFIVVIKVKYPVAYLQKAAVTLVASFEITYIIVSCKYQSQHTFLLV